MAVVGDKAFVMGNKQLLLFKTGLLYILFLFESALSGVAKTYDGNLWVSCTKPASIIKVSPVDYKTIDSHTLNVSIGAGWELPLLFLLKMILSISVMPALSYTDMFFSQNETEEVADIKSMWRMQGFIITVWELIR